MRYVHSHMVDHVRSRSLYLSNERSRKGRGSEYLGRTTCSGTPQVRSSAEHMVLVPMWDTVQGTAEEPVDDTYRRTRTTNRLYSEFPTARMANTFTLLTASNDREQEPTQSTQPHRGWEYCYLPHWRKTTQRTQ